MKSTTDSMFILASLGSCFSPYFSLFSLTQHTHSLFSLLAASMIIRCMHLGGVQSRARCLLFCFPFMPLATAYLLTLDQWYKATSLIKNRITSTESGEDNLSKLARPINLVLIWIGNPIIASVIPMIVYDDKFSLNWAYAGSITYQGLVALNIQIGLTLMTYRLLRACTPEGGVEQTDDLKAVVQKVNTSTSNHPRLVAPISPPIPSLFVSVSSSAR